MDPSLQGCLALTTRIADRAIPLLAEKELHLGSAKQEMEPQGQDRNTRDRLHEHGHFPRWIWIPTKGLVTLADLVESFGSPHGCPSATVSVNSAFCCTAAQLMQA